MGAGPFTRSSSCCESAPTERPKQVAPNPDPHKFELKKLHFVGGGAVVMIHYPGCTNYEGNKVLAYRYEGDFKQCLFDGRIDPHFCEKHISPIARFVPTEEGFEMACEFLRLLEFKKGK